MVLLAKFAIFVFQFPIFKEETSHDLSLSEYPSLVGFSW